MCNIKDPFVRLLVYGLGGAVVGLVGGFLLGLGIWGLQLLVCYVGDSNMCSGELVTMATFLGSAFGALLGALLGGVFALKKK